MEGNKIGFRGFILYFILSPVYLKSIFSGEHYVQAHNDYLQLLIEAGWAAAVPLVAGFFYFLIRSFRQVKRVGMSNGRLQFFVGCGALSGLVSMAFHSFFDFNLQIPTNAVYFVTLITLVYGCFWEEDGRRRTDWVIWGVRKLYGPTHQFC